MIVRDAIISDLASITDIYNEVLLHTTAIYRDEVTTTEERAEWWRAQQQKGYPPLGGGGRWCNHRFCQLWRLSSLAGLSVYG